MAQFTVLRYIQSASLPVIPIQPNTILSSLGSIKRNCNYCTNTIHSQHPPLPGSHIYRWVNWSSV